MAVKRTILNHYECMARRTHRCCICDGMIVPGDVYECTVEVRSVGSYRYLWIHKEHVNPPCVDPPPEEWFRDVSNVLPFTIQLPRAA